MSADPGRDRGPEPPALLSWSVRPCTRHRCLAVVVAAFILALSLAVQVLFGSPWWGLLALLLLGLSVAPHYAGATYALTAEGASVRGLLVTHRRAWSEVKAHFPDAEGVLLSPLSKPTRLAYTRGLYLRFADNRDEVLACVERLAGQAARDSGADGGGADG